MMIIVILCLDVQQLYNIKFRQKKFSAETAIRLSGSTGIRDPDYDWDHSQYYIRIPSFLPSFLPSFIHSFIQFIHRFNYLTFTSVIAIDWLIHSFVH